jgi:hypothetical protein
MEINVMVGTRRVLRGTLTIAAAALGVWALPLGTGCSSSGPPQAVEETGSVSAAVSSVGPDGATYSLPSGTNLVIAHTDGTFITCRSFVGSSATETFSIPSGTYSLGLSTTCALEGGGGDAGTTAVPFTLNRSGDGGASTVSALLQNPVQTVTITAGGTTPVVFNFNIQSLGTVTFGTGSTTVGIATSPDASIAPPTSGAVAGSFGPTSYTDSSGGAKSGLTSLFATPATVQYNLTMQSLSAFTANFDDQICATFVASIGTAPGTPIAYQALLSGELSGGAGTICFADANSSYAQNTVAISVSRAGAAKTVPLQTALSNGADAGTPGATFLLTLNAPTATVYNGSTAALGQFSSPVTFPGAFTAVSISSVDGSQRYGFVNGAATFSLSLSP